MGISFDSDTEQIIQKVNRVSQPDVICLLLLLLKRGKRQGDCRPERRNGRISCQGAPHRMSTTFLPISLDMTWLGNSPSTASNVQCLLAVVAERKMNFDSTTTLNRTMPNVTTLGAATLPRGALAADPRRRCCCCCWCWCCGYATSRLNTKGMMMLRSVQRRTAVVKVE